MISILSIFADGEKVEGTECDENLRADKRGEQKSFRSPRNTLIFKKVAVKWSRSPEKGKSPINLSDRIPGRR